MIPKEFLVSMKSWSLVTERDRANEVDVNLCRLGISRLRLKY
jgi:hypothetical protein